MAPELRTLDHIDQAEVIAFLKRPETYGLDSEADVRCIETHGALIFLAGDHAYKLKRDVKLPYLDFSSLEKRRLACENEVQLNRRTAPNLYLGVLEVVQTVEGGLALARGEAQDDVTVVDWLVEMRRFPDDALLSSVVDQGALSGQVVHGLADTIATFHQAAEQSSAWGGADELARIAKGDAESFARYSPVPFDPQRVRALAKAMLAAVEAHRELLERRRTDGFVRHGHGDLHLANIYLDHDQPRLFDAIEFDDRLAQNDVLYDLAFLLMDLWHRQLRGEANRVFSRYLLRTDDLDGLAAMPLFLSLRAGIRAHVTATMAENAGGDEGLRAEARSYLDLAADVLRPRPACLLAVGGFSGSGKTYLASALAPLIGAVPGAVHLRSDELRKIMLGQEPEDRLGPESYRSKVSARVYEELRSRAARALASGQAVIADAVHNRADSRAALAAIARDAGVPFLGIWLDADPALMAERIRSRTGDASDADAEVMQQQVAAGAGPMDWHRIDAALPTPEKLQFIQRLIDKI